MSPGSAFWGGSSPTSSPRRESSNLIMDLTHGEIVVMKVVRTLALGLSLLAALVSAPISSAQTFASGDFTLSDPLSDATGCPSVARSEDKGFAVAWNGAPLGQPFRRSIFVRLFDAAGVAKTAPIQVTPLELSAVAAPSVAMAADGSFVVASEVLPLSGPAHVVLHRFDARGRSRGGMIRAEVDPTHLQEAPDLAIASDGSFAVAWTRFDPFTNSPADAAIRFFDRDGRALGSARRLQAGPRPKISPRIAASRDGRYAVVWTAGTAAGSFATFGRIYDSRGRAISPISRVTLDEGRPTSFPSVAFSPDGRQLVVAWTDPSIDPPPAVTDGAGRVGVAAQIFTDRFEAVAPAIHLNQFVNGAQSLTAVSGVPGRSDGSFLVAWESAGEQDGSGTGIFGRVLREDTEPIENERRLNQRALGNQSCPALASSSSGRGVVAWHETRNGADRIVGRLLGRR